MIIIKKNIKWKRKHKLYLEWQQLHCQYLIQTVYEQDYNPSYVHVYPQILTNVQAALVRMEPSVTTCRINTRAHVQEVGKAQTVT